MEHECDMKATPHSNIKTAIEKITLTRSNSDNWLQRVATAYIGETEYRVYAQAKAYGFSLDWVDRYLVRTPDLEAE